MVSTKIDAFHTCHLQGSISTILEKVPYHSNANEEQWLGQGYYFWTDSHFFATKWGERKDKYPNGSLYTTNFTEPLSYQGSAFLKLPKSP